MAPQHLNKEAVASTGRGTWRLTLFAMSLLGLTTLMFKLVTGDTDDLGFQQSFITGALGGATALTVHLLTRSWRRRGAAMLLSLLSFIGVALTVWITVGRLEG